MGDSSRPSYMQDSKGRIMKKPEDLYFLTFFKIFSKKSTEKRRIFFGKVSQELILLLHCFCCISRPLQQYEPLNRRWSATWNLKIWCFLSVFGFFGCKFFLQPVIFGLINDNVGRFCIKYLLWPIRQQAKGRQSSYTKWENDGRSLFFQRFR